MGEGSHPGMLSEEPSSDSNSELRDARLKILELELRAELASTIKNYVDQEKAQLKSDLALLSKVVLIAVAVVSAALGVIGLQGWSEVRTRVDDAVARRLDEHLKVSPPARYEKDVERLYEKSVVQAYLAQIPRPVDARIFPETPSLATQDWASMLDILTAPETDEDTCVRILRILSYYHGYASLPTTGVSRLRSLVVSEPSPAWLANSPRRLAYLIRALSSFEDREASSKIRDLLAHKATPQEVQFAALEYVRELYVFEARPEVEAILSANDIRGDLETSALRTLAVIKPDSPKLVAVLSKLDNGQSLSQREIFTCMAIITGLTQLGLSQHVASFDEVTRRDDLAGKVLSGVMKQDYHLEQWANGVRLVFRTAALENQDVPPDILLSLELSEVAGHVFGDYVEQKDLKAVNRMVSHFTAFESTTGELYFAPHVAFFVGAFGLEGGQLVDSTNTVDGVWLTPQGEAVVVNWVDLAGASRSGLLRAVDKVSFGKDFRIERAPAWLSKPHRFGGRHPISRPQTPRHF